MTEQLVRANPSQIPNTLKEAVVDALVNLTYAQISGEGATGKHLYGARPRVLLNSGFLLPSPEGAQDNDEVTSPIWISSHGLQLQVASGDQNAVTVIPRCAVYVRVLPTEADLSRPACRLDFALKKELHQKIQGERRRRLNEEWEKGGYSSRADLRWKEAEQRIVAEVHAAHGITAPTQPQLQQPGDEVIAPADDPGDAEPTEVVTAAPDMKVPLSDAHHEPLPVPHKWLRLDLELPALRINLGVSDDERQLVLEAHAAALNASIASQLETWANSSDPSDGGQMWGYRRLVKVTPSMHKPWSKFLEHARKSGPPNALPKIELAWDIEITTDWLDPTRQNLFISLENRSESPSQHKEDTEEAIFLVSLEVRMPSETHRPLRLERVEPSYRYNWYLTYPAIGHNGGVISRASTGPDVVLETTWKPRYVQPRIVPTDVAGVQRRVRALAEPSSLDGIAPLASALDSWLKRTTEQTDPTAGLEADDEFGRAREEQAFEDDVRAWAGELNAVRAGLRLLDESRAHWLKRGPQSDPKATVYEAWLAMNEAMANFMQRRFGKDENDWRLFQLAFVVANIPAFASRIRGFEHHYDEHRDDAVTLLYFATGGGKSEAFFGLLVFALLLDRLRGKEVGVTALLRYPLRLLTIQQAQRCARVMAQAELVRRARGYGGREFAIGFWVGSGGSPNNHRTPGVNKIPDVTRAQPSPALEQRLLDTDPEYVAVLRAWRKLPACPFCGANTALRLFVANGTQTLGHVCTDINCGSNGGQYQPLPFYIVDEDIYDLAPAVLLGTVDKLALIGHSPRTIRRIYGMFGAAPWIHAASGRLHVPDFQELKAKPESKGMAGLYPAYSTGRRFFHDPFPSLIIQDEAHLLDESLGTFAGLFESALDAVFQELASSLDPLVAKDPTGKPRRPKVIAASATVAEPQRQLEHLYQRAIPSTQFPHPGPSLYESFYAKPDLAPANERERRDNPDVEVASRQARVYTALMTNGKPHTATSVAVLAAFHYSITLLFDKLASTDPTDLASVRTLLTEHISMGPLQQLHRDLLSRASPSELATLVDLHRISLTYVTNKKGGDQIMAAEAEETRKRHLNAGVPLDAIDTRLITGSVDQGEIQAVVDTAQRRVRPGEPFPRLRDQLRSVIATSAVSHGVDVDEFNSMFFAGMPSDIAEYIQASSRIGRTHVGFAVLVPTPQRRRDRHIVQIFDSFHRFLERMVQPAAIDRFAERAIERVFPSMFQAYLTGTVPSCEIIDLADDRKDGAKDLSYIPNVRREVEQRGVAFSDEINRFLLRAVGLTPMFSPDGSEHYQRRLAEKTRRLLHDTWSTPIYGNSPVASFFRNSPDAEMRPMTSLRDVDESGLIFMSRRDARGHRQEMKEVTSLMTLIRNGVGDDDAATED